MTTTTPTALTGTYRLDPRRTRLGFVARQAMVAKVRGTFDTFTGLAHLDFADPARSRVEVSVEVASLTTGNARRDAHLRSSFFDATEHPRITFRSTRVDVLTDDRYLLTGELTIKDRTRPVSIEVVRTGTSIDPDGTSRVELRGRGTLDRRDWGVAWNAAAEGGGAFVGNTIVIELEVDAVRRRVAGSAV
jgi:polyisoprenoid-binding protein YceI